MKTRHAGNSQKTNLQSRCYISCKVAKPVDSLSREELAEKLADFGLTINQAIVYLSVVQLGKASVDRIAEDTRLHRQDIYKMMPKLQKMGLVTKILGRPAFFEATRVEKALENLLAMEKKEAEEKISRLTADLKTLVETVRKRHARKTSREEDPLFCLLTTDLEIKNNFDSAFEKAKKEFCLVTTPTIAPRTVNLIRERVWSLAKKGVKTRVIIESRVPEATRDLLSKLDREHTSLAAKQVVDASLVPYRIVDDKEVWITLKKETKTGTPWFLWTNSHNIVKFYRKNFEETWNDPNAESLADDEGHT